MTLVCLSGLEMVVMLFVITTDRFREQTSRHSIWFQYNDKVRLSVEIIRSHITTGEEKFTGPKTHCITIVVLLPRGQVKTTFKGKNMDTYHHTNHQISFSFFHPDFF